MSHIDESNLPGMYLSLVSSFLQGFIRFARARIVSLSAGNAILQYKSEEAKDLSNHPYARVLERIQGISREEYDSFQYVTNVSHLVYLTTLLDTFLSDTTKFLFLLHPSAIGKNQSVTLETLLGVKSTSQLIEDVATKRAREIGFLPFLARIDFFREKFGLRIQLDSSTISALEHYSGIRNAVVHDQAIFDCTLQAGKIAIRRKTCPLHPTPVSDKDLVDAEAAYRRVVREVCRAVIEQVLRAADNTVYKSLLPLFEPLPRK